MIYTFYSYKGGVGRSMALANVAELMYKAGLKVIIIDWDLEAPGLERFFSVKTETILARPGVIDMLLAYQEKARRFDPESKKPFFPVDNIKNYLVDLYPDVIGPGKLYLLPAGCRLEAQFASYASRVLNFDWQDLYQNWEGEIYFEWVREELDKIADAILIDSRTGVTEMGGVCTYQLADIVILLCAANYQNMEGTYRMVKNLSDPTLREVRHGRELKTLVVPSRIETSAELEVLNETRQKFRDKFYEYIPAELQPGPEFFIELEIPSVPLYAFEEIVAVNQTGSSAKRAVNLEEAYSTLLHYLAYLAPKESVVKKRLIKPEKANRKYNRNRNPFHYPGPVPPDKFVSHQKNANFCLENLLAQQPTNIAIIGERRIGKTSLLHYLEFHLSQKEWGQHLPLFLDSGIFGGRFSQEHVWFEILDSLQDCFEANSPIRDEVVKLLEKSNKTGLSMRRLLKILHRYYPERRLILLLDEFELIVESYNQNTRDFLTALRTLSLMSENNFIVVTATRAPLSEVCAPFAQDSGIEFHSNFVVCELETLDEVETKSVIETLLIETSVKFTLQELDQTWRISQWPSGGAHPIFVQVAASLIFDFKQQYGESLDYSELKRQFESKTLFYHD